MCASFCFFSCYYWSVIIYIPIFVYNLISLGATSYTVCIFSGILISIVSNCGLLMSYYIYTFRLYLYIILRIMFYAIFLDETKWTWTWTLILIVILTLNLILTLKL